MSTGEGQRSPRTEKLTELELMLAQAQLMANRRRSPEPKSPRWEQVAEMHGVSVDELQAQLADYLGVKWSRPT